MTTLQNSAEEIVYDLLHAAAAKLRANTISATPGPFDIEIDDGTVYVANFDGYRIARVGSSDRPASIGNGTQIASWSPAASFGLADWFEAAARRDEPGELRSAAKLAKSVLDPHPLADQYEQLADVREREALVHEDPALAAQIRQGIDEAEAGRTVDRGSFAQHLGADED